MKINSTALNVQNTYQIKNKVQIQKNDNQEQAVSKQPITNDERDYFMRLYPENKEEIMDYHHYLRSGKMSGVSIGSIFDRRG